MILTREEWIKENIEHFPLDMKWREWEIYYNYAIYLELNRDEARSKIP